MGDGVTAQEAHDRLEKPDVTVTNQSDKRSQLPKILNLNTQVKDFYLHAAGAQGGSVSPGAPHTFYYLHVMGSITWLVHVMRYMVCYVLM